MTKATAEAWCASNGGYKYYETQAMTGEGVSIVFTDTARLAMQKVDSEDNDGMPTSLASATGAIKIDRQTEAEATENKQKKKKKCKC